MIHVNSRDGHEWLTEEQFKEKHPALHAAIHAPRPHNEGGQILRNARKAADMTVRELARAVGMTAGDLSAIETGRTKPTQQEIDAITWAIQEKREQADELRKCGCGEEGPHNCNGGDY